MIRESEIRTRLAQHAVAGRYGAFLGIGGGLFLLGLILCLFWGLQGADAGRAWQVFHVNWLFFTSLAGGSIAVVAAQKITKAKWSGLIIRFAEAAVAFFPLSILGLILIFTVGYPHIYGPMTEQLHSLGHNKAVWLSHDFMFGRLLVGLCVLYWVGWKLVRADLVPDMLEARQAATGTRRRMFERWAERDGFDGSPHALAWQEAKIARLAPIYAVLYAIVFTWVGFDGIMALQPHWFSNLLGGWFFMGAFLGGFTLLALTMLYGTKHLGVRDLLSPKQRHDLGKLIFGFTVFWAYLMWAQFLIIWYGNMPEETGFVFARLWGNWLPIGRWVFLGMFVIPFIGLLGVAPKKSPVTLSFFAAVSLVALWLERYLLVMPSVTTANGPRFTIAEVGPTALMAGLFLLTYALFARTFPMLSPRLADITLQRELGHGHVDTAMYEHDEAAKDYIHEADVEKDLA
ncbi:MAG TPA: hypothetical protein VFS40_13390 [Gemmatimonadales bacterium]|nr:hypothetical protein [Gemmatimonadales bacterium]